MINVSDESVPVFGFLAQSFPNARAMLMSLLRSIQQGRFDDINIHVTFVEDETALRLGASRTLRVQIDRPSTDALYHVDFHVMPVDTLALVASIPTLRGWMTLMKLEDHVVGWIVGEALLYLPEARTVERRLHSGF